MGDFSRNPKTRLDDAISKHYVGVRMQQGVPILDTDLNELEDLRKHELYELFRQFIGDGVPDGNDGFRVEALKNGGAGTIVLTANTLQNGFSSLEIDLLNSTAASILGFLPGNTYTERRGSSPARLTGNAAEPFALSEGLTFTVRTNGEAGETITFSTVDFGDISQATTQEIVDVLNNVITRATAQAGTGNDFIIIGGNGTVENAGRLLVAGQEVLNETNLVYTSQPLYENTDLGEQWKVDPVPAIETPSGSDRADVVYIDVWEREVTTEEDDSIKLPALGLETTTRSRREWAIRVVLNATDLSGITKLAGHQYLALAIINREVTDGDKITEESITDLRRQNLNLAKYLKTPISITRGTEILNVTRYATIMSDLKLILLTRLQNRVFDFTYSDDYNQTLVLIAIQDIIHECAFVAIQAQTGNFNNTDGFNFLSTLYDLQKEFVRVVDLYGNELGNAQEFIDDYEKYLDGSAPENIQGLKPALDADDFIAAALAQDAINGWLSAPADILPEGSVIVTLKGVTPDDEILEFDKPFLITYEIESLATSPRQKEAYNISIGTVVPSSWDMALNKTQIEVDAFGGKDIVDLVVTPRAGAASVQFKLTATSVRTSLVTFTHTSEEFAVGSLPPGEEFFQWIAPPLDSEGRIPFLQSDFSDGEANFQLNLINTSDTDEQTFEVLHFVIPPTGQEGQWHPEEGEATPTQITLTAGESRIDTSSIFGPVSPAIGTEGTLITQATLVEVNGTPVTDGKSTELELTFIIVSS